MDQRKPAIKRWGKLRTVIAIAVTLGLLCYRNYQEYRPIDWRFGCPAGWPVAFVHCGSGDGVEFDPRGVAIDAGVAVLTVAAVILIDRRLLR